MRLHFPMEAISDMNSLGSRTSSRPVRSQIMSNHTCSVEVCQESGCA